MTDWQYRSWLCNAPSQDVCESRPNGPNVDIQHLDLAGSVSYRRKQAARFAVTRILQNAGPNRRAVRLNALSNADGIADLAYHRSNPFTAEIIIASKVEAARDIEILSTLLHEGGWDGELFAMIETPRALRKLNVIAASGGRLRGLIFGAAELCTGYGVDIDSLGTIARLAKCEIAGAAAAHGLIAVDSPCFDLKDSALFTEELLLAQELGFDGKIASDICQIDSINTAFGTKQRLSEVAQETILAASTQNGLEFKIGGPNIGSQFPRRDQAALNQLSRDP